MEASQRNILLIFIKNPRLGKVKTRLAQNIGEQQALKVYQQLLKITHAVVSPLHCRRQIWYSDFISNDYWQADKYDKRLQKGNNLGERMRNAFHQAFADGCQKTVIIGSDCAELTTKIIENAFRKLDDHDIVIGPSKDGGYYLLGMTSFYEDLFSSIPWSTPTVYQQTIGRANELDLSYYNLPTLNDIDTKQDLTKSDINLRDF